MDLKDYLDNAKMTGCIKVQIKPITCTLTFLAFTCVHYRLIYISFFTVVRNVHKDLPELPPLPQGLGI